jgi:hypothetical protein
LEKIMFIGSCVSRVTQAWFVPNRDAPVSFPSSLRPSSLRPSSLRPSSLRPSSLRPSSLRPSSLSPPNSNPSVPR